MRLLPSTLVLCLAACHARPPLTSPLSNAAPPPAHVTPAPSCEIIGPQIVTAHADAEGRSDAWLRYDPGAPAGARIRVLTCAQLDIERAGRALWLASGL